MPNAFLQYEPTQLVLAKRLRKTPGDSSWLGIRWYIAQTMQFMGRAAVMEEHVSLDVKSFGPYAENVPDIMLTLPTSGEPDGLPWKNRNNLTYLAAMATKRLAGRDSILVVRLVTSGGEAQLTVGLAAQEVLGEFNLDTTRFAEYLR